MKKTITIASLILVYALSAWHNYKFIQKQLSRKDSTYGNADLSCLYMTICPIVNTYAAIYIEYRTTNFYLNINLNSFFNVKK